ncbi:MAG: toll/interleukin-1 receptor domain-containing protein [Lachnospiraceae bacterium]|nr:toll/interleukin-1 receptor domain-containing protein [Lachnospiraceae bacterium]
MATILKCKMCGGDIEISQDMTIGTCLYCGSTMTMPRIDSEKKIRLFNRANGYRLNNEYDKAYQTYEAIVQEDEQEAEAYWGMILSEYGVEYVEDPKTGRRIPTCHRTHIQPIQSSTNFELACKYADAESLCMYREEAESLDKLQRKIIALSEKASGYDVFICYKETDDETGERTQDSVLAQSIYDELEKQGIKTFFSRITLEDKLGTDYEPYIYGALKSSKVMLLVAMNGDYCDAVWVKNEWRRFLNFMEEDDSKVMIPVYQGMSAYEFPMEVSKYQAQDMGKVGAIQDLVRGIKKIVGEPATNTNDAVLNALMADKREREEQKLKKKKRRKRFWRTVAILILLIALVIGGYYYVIIPNQHYGQALIYIEQEEYVKAFKELEKCKNFKDAEELVVQYEEKYNEQYYQIAEQYIENGMHDQAIEIFKDLGDYSDSYYRYFELVDSYSEKLLKQDSGVNNCTLIFTIIMEAVEYAKDSEEIEILKNDVVQIRDVFEYCGRYDSVAKCYQCLSKMNVENANEMVGVYQEYVKIAKEYENKMKNTSIVMKGQMNTKSKRRIYKGAEKLYILFKEQGRLYITTDQNDFYEIINNSAPDYGTFGYRWFYNPKTETICIRNGAWYFNAKIIGTEMIIEMLQSGDYPSDYEEYLPETYTIFDTSLIEKK